MLASVKEIFELNTIEINARGERTPLHSNTSKEQGLFLQQMFDVAKPLNSLEVGFAYGISTLFILEKHKEKNSSEGCHIVIEPDTYWGTAAVHNIEKEGLINYLDKRNDFSDKVLTQLFHQGHRIQYAYIDTTKRFDIVMQDFYFIDKLLDVGGIIVLDDCGGNWPGVQRVARYVNTLPHYRIAGKHCRIHISFLKKMVNRAFESLLRVIPFKNKLSGTFNFKTNRQLGLDYSCIAFQKIDADSRNWDWDKPF